MSVPATCTNCGLRFTSRQFHVENSQNVTFDGCTESCPRCGGRAKLQDGTYDFIGSAVAAFRAPGVTRKDIERFRSIAEAAKERRITPDLAGQQIKQINVSFGTLWDWANSNAGALAILISVITLVLMMYDSVSSNADAKTAHKDAQQILEVQERIYAAL